MANNIVEQLVIDNRAELFSDTVDSVDSSNTLQRFAKNEGRLTPAINQAVIYVASKDVKREAVNVLESDTNVDIQEIVSNYINTINEQNNTAEIASSVEYEMRREINAALNASTAKEIYNIKKSPELILEKINSQEVLKKYIKKTNDTLTYINKTRENKTKNSQLI